MQVQSHSNSQFNIEQNVEYKVINTRKVIELLHDKGFFPSAEAAGALDLAKIKEEAIASGLTAETVQRLVDSCAREIFSENKLGSSLLRGIRHFVKDPITADGVIKKGFLNQLAANGIQIGGLTGKFGNKRDVKNLITNAGFAGIASRINGSGAEAAFTYIAVGTGTNAASASDTTLQTESSTSGLSRAAASVSRVTTTQTNDTAQLVLTYTVTGTVAVTESGVLNAASVGTLLCRQTFSAINVVNGDSLQITWKVKAS